MSVFVIVGMAVIGVVVISLIRQVKPEVAPMLSLALGVAILIAIIRSFDTLLDELMSIADRAGVKSEYMKIMLKVIGVAYIAAFSGQLCRDAGESALAQKVELAAKVGILLMALPVIRAILDALTDLTPAALSR